MQIVSFIFLASALKNEFQNKQDYDLYNGCSFITAALL